MSVNALSGVHGIGNHGYLKAAAFDMSRAVEAIEADWSGWLGRGLGRKDAGPALPARVHVAYYADCVFRGTRLGPEDPARLTPFGQGLLAAWIDEVRVAELGETAVPLVRQGRLTVALRTMTQWFTERFGAQALQIVSAAVSELAAYFDPEFPEARLDAQDRVVAVLRRRSPRVLLAHSLGSVVAYEALSAHPDLTVDLFVTLGSPLAMNSVVFERLLFPSPGRGAKPPGVGIWVNIADRGDPVAVPRKGLSRRFTGVARDHETSIHPVDPHRVRNYLRCPELVAEISPYLTPGTA